MAASERYPRASSLPSRRVYTTKWRSGGMPVQLKANHPACMSRTNASRLQRHPSGFKIPVPTIPSEISARALKLFACMPGHVCDSCTGYIRPHSLPAQKTTTKGCFVLSAPGIHCAAFIYARPSDALSATGHFCEIEKNKKEQIERFSVSA